jgi:hypothetical protein
MALSEIEVLHTKLTDCLSTVKLGVAGRLLYYDENINAFILAMHSTGPEQTNRATELAWESIPQMLREELQSKKIGFAGKQI